MDIHIKNISKTYKETRALDKVSFTFLENKIYGLLGRNGAGKTTLLNLITNKIFPTEGEIFLDTEPILENDKALANIYCMVEKNTYPKNMKVRDGFSWSKEFFSSFSMESALDLAKKFNIGLNKKMSELSTGYSSIFKIIVALSIHTPIILLDEPVLGLDANHRDLFYKLLVESYSENPRTFVLSTHLIEEVSDLVERVVILKEGKLIIDDEAENLLNKGYSVSGPSSMVDGFIQDKKVLGVTTIGGLKTASVYGQSVKNLPSGLELSKLDLQRLFIELTN